MGNGFGSTKCQIVCSTNCAKKLLGMALVLFKFRLCVTLVYRMWYTNFLCYPFNPQHRACLPKQSLKAYNLTVKRPKNCKIVWETSLHKYPFKFNNKQDIRKKPSTLVLSGPAVNVRAKKMRLPVLFSSLTRQSLLDPARVCSCRCM